jgi:hypothetical protein
MNGKPGEKVLLLIHNIIRKLKINKEELTLHASEVKKQVIRQERCENVNHFGKAEEIFWKSVFLMGNMHDASNVFSSHSKNSKKLRTQSYAFFTFIEFSLQEEQNILQKLLLCKLSKGNELVAVSKIVVERVKSA